MTPEHTPNAAANSSVADGSAATDASVDSVVIGRSLPALAAALELAEVGLSVRVVGTAAYGVGSVSEGSVSAAIAGADAAGATTTDAAVGFAVAGHPDGVRDAAHTFEEFVTHVSAPLIPAGASAPGEPDATAPVRRVTPLPTQLRGTSGDWTAMPEPAVCGIPAVPFSEAASAILGSAGATRAYLDRITPVLTIGKTHELGRLVSKRLGATARDRLVAPVVHERFGVGPDHVDVAIAVPGLNEALTRVGSLSGAVLAESERDAARELRVAPSAGWVAFIAALETRLRAFGVEFVDADAVDAVDLSSGHAANSVDGEPSAQTWQIEVSDGSVVTARALVRETDATCVVAPGGVDALDTQPGRVRSTARVMLAASPADQPDDAASLQVVDTSAGKWTVRTMPVISAARATGDLSASDQAPAAAAAGASACVAYLAGPAAERAIGAVDDSNAVLAAVREALEGVELVGDVDTAQIVRRTAAVRTLAERDAAEAAREAARAARPDVVAVGVSQHGDDLAAAIASARREAVALRRKLTGITD